MSNDENGKSDNNYKTTMSNEIDNFIENLRERKDDEKKKLDKYKEKCTQLNKEINTLKKSIGEKEDSIETINNQINSSNNVNNNKNANSNTDMDGKYIILLINIRKKQDKTDVWGPIRQNHRANFLAN